MKKNEKFRWRYARYFSLIPRKSFHGSDQFTSSRRKKSATRSPYSLGTTCE
jgi:hypothetical protein